MKSRKTKRKIAETVLGASVGAAIAGPAGAVAGGVVGSQVATHTSPLEASTHARQEQDEDADDPIVHAELKRILVPLDFSHPSRRALRFAREWATRFGSEICLLHVVEPMNNFSVFGPEPIAMPFLPADFHEQARLEIEKLIHQELPESARVSVHLRDGTPYDQISIVAQELEVDLIIIATHGYTGLKHVMLGSTAERVVRHAPCPVLTLRRAAKE